MDTFMGSTILFNEGGEISSTLVVCLNKSSNIEPSFGEDAVKEIKFIRGGARSGPNAAAVPQGKTDGVTHVGWLLKGGKKRDAKAK